MGFFEALFSGAKALVSGVLAIGKAVVGIIFEEFDRSRIGKAAARLADGVTETYFKKANDIAEEERELSEKFQRDKRRTESDIERLEKIEQERKELREKIERANKEKYASELRDKFDETLAAKLDDDEISSNVGIISAKQCPTCNGTMRIRQGGIDEASRLRKFYWQCTNPRFPICPTIKLNPMEEHVTVVRPPDPDLDTPKELRRATWNRQDIVSQTHGRVRQHLGDADEQIICPHHLMPMKLLPKRHVGGRVLDSYEYVCLGVNANGAACKHTVELSTMPQVAAMLKRTEGTGIIK